MKLNVLKTLSIDAGDVVSLCARSAKAGATPHTAAPCHQVCVEMPITSLEMYLPGKGAALAWELMKLVMKPGSQLASHVLTSCCCSIGQICLRPFYALNCHKSISYISSTYVTIEKGVINTYVIL